MSILAPPDVWDEDADLFDLGDGEVIAGRLERLGWRRRPSYGFTGPGAAVYIMSSAITGSEMWLDIRGPKPHLVRAALDPLGVERLAEEVGQEGHTSQRTVPDVTAHALVTAEVYLPSAYTGVIVAAYDTQAGTTLCHVQHADGMREVLWNELEQLHAQLNLPPPTATYGVEELEEEVALARPTTELPVADRPADIDSLPFDAPPEGGQRRSHTTWRNVSAAVCFGDRLTLEPYRSTPSEDES
jgi:hypothetical protein